MAALTVVKFPTASGADDALDTLHRLQNQELIRVHDAAVVTWPKDRKKPTTHELHDTKKAGALGGAFWGFLFVLTSDAVLDRVAAEFRGSDGEIIHTNLSQEQEARLHEAFDED